MAHVLDVAKEAFPTPSCEELCRQIDMECPQGRADEANMLTTFGSLLTLRPWGAENARHPEQSGCNDLGAQETERPT